MNEEFEKWLNKTYPCRSRDHHITAVNYMLKGWRACEKHLQAKINDLLVHKDNLILSNIQLATLNAEQAEEIKALRGFANEVYMKEYSPAANEALLNFHLINEYGEPTKLLIGDEK